MGPKRQARAAGRVRASAGARDAMRHACGYLAVILLAVGLAITVRPAMAQEVAGNALRFDGVDDLARAADPGALSFPQSSYTVELWVKLETLDSPLGLASPLAKGASINTTLADNPYAFFVTGNSSDNNPGAVFFSYEWSPPTGSELSPVINVFANGFTLPVGEWVHLAAVFERGGGSGPDFFNSARIYVNGQLAGVDANAPSPDQNSADVTIGNFFGNLRPFPGEIDEVRIWNVARTDDQIRDDFNRLVDPTHPDLVARWNFDEAIGDDNIFDQTANGLNGTLGARLDTGEFPDTDNPTRVVSTAPLVADLAECQFSEAELRSLCLSDSPESNTDNSYILFFGNATTDAGPINGFGPANCTCPNVDVRDCSSISGADDACFPDGFEPEALGSFSQENVSVTGSTCTITCFPLDGMRICQQICF